MKAAVFFEHGGPDNIQITDVPKPQIDSRQALVNVKACGLNYFDLQVLHGWTTLNGDFPFWGGGDISGVVAEVGDDIASFKLGDRVIIFPGLFCGRCEYCIAGEESLCVNYGIVGDTIPGGCAEFIAVNESNLMHLPEDMSFEEAAAVPLVFQTAWRALVTQAQIRAGEDVLILGASGGVATAAIQIAKLAGARVFAVTSTHQKVQQAQALGADICLNRIDDDYWATIMEHTNHRGVDIVLESVGAATWENSLKSLAKGGRLVTIGRTTGNIGKTDIGLVFWHQLHIIGSTMANRKEFSEVMQLVFQHKLRPVIDTVFPLEQAHLAYQRLDEGEQFGKVIIKISN
ncbi:MAG: zinc-binding dehydrogenase [Chloroflexota bacterium]